MMKEAEEGRLKVMYVVGENPLLSEPDLRHAREAMENLKFLVVQDIFLTRDRRDSRRGLPRDQLC